MNSFCRRLSNAIVTILNKINNLHSNNIRSRRHHYHMLIRQIIITICRQISKKQLFMINMLVSYQCWSQKLVNVSVLICNSGANCYRNSLILSIVKNCPKNYCIIINKFYCIIKIYILYSKTLSKLNFFSFHTQKHFNGHKIIPKIQCNFCNRISSIYNKKTVKNSYLITLILITLI